MKAAGRARGSLGASLLLTLAGVAIPGGVLAAEGRGVAAVDRMLEALGGKERLETLRSLSVEARCLGPDGPFETAVESLRPGRVHFRQTSEDGTTEIWSTPSATWTVGEDGTARELSAGVRSFVRSHEFHLLLFEVYERFSGHAPGGERVVDGTRCAVVRMEDGEGRPAALCIDPANDLPVALELNPEAAEGPITILFGDWSRIGDIQYFWAFLLVEGTRAFRYSYVGIRPDALSEDAFPPAPGP